MVSYGTFYLIPDTPSEPKPNAFIQTSHSTYPVTTSTFPTNQEGGLSSSLTGSATHFDFGHGATIGYYQIGRFISPALYPQTISAQTINCIMSGFEAQAQANAEWEVELFVWGSGDSVRGTLGHTNGNFPEMNTSTETESSGSFTCTAVTVQAGDKLYAELLYNATGAKAESLSRLHSGTADVSTYNSRIVFANPVSYTEDVYKSSSFSYKVLVSIISDFIDNLNKLIITGFTTVLKQLVTNNKIFKNISNITSFLYQLITGGLSSISKTLVSIYKSISIIQRLTAMKYNIRNSIGRTLVFMYSIKMLTAKGVVVGNYKIPTYVYKICVSIYKLKTNIVKISSLLYNSKSYILKQLTIGSYKLHSFISKAHSLLYYNRVFVTVTSSLKYNSKVLVSKASSVVYRLNLALGKLLNLVYSSRINLFKILNFIYNLRNNISKLQSFLYKIISLVILTTSVKYNIRNLTNRLTSFKYSSMVNMFKTFYMSYKLYNLVSKIQNIVYKLGSNIFKILTSLYNIRSITED